jgi:membrane associated rhomboid family serine protease
VIPLRDDAPSRRIPWVIVALLTFNTVVLLCECIPGLDAVAVVGRYGLVPWRFFHSHATGAHVSEVSRFVPIVSSMFLHDGWLHLATNMVYLWTFGRALEDRLGSVGVAGTFFLSGIAAALGQLLAHPHSNAAMVGASGAIAGILGAYLVCFPRARVTIAFPFFYVPWLFRVRAWVFLLGWFALQVGKGTMDLASGTLDPAVAWWAHAAGFMAGLTGAVAGRAWASDEVRASVPPRPTLMPVAG